MTITRRRFLRGLGATAATIPLFSSGLRRADAQIEIPKRVLFLYAGSGSVAGRWQPVAAAGRPAPDQDTWACSPFHAALAPYQGDINYYRGLSMGDRWDNPTGADAHTLGRAHAMICRGMATSTLAGGISIDQHIAQGLRAGGVTTSLASVEMVASGYEPLVDASPSYTGPASPVPYLYDPVAVYRHLFGDGPVPDDTPTPPVNTRPQQRSDVLTFLEGRYGTLAGRLSPEDRVKLEQHRDTLADIRGRIAAAPPVNSAGRIPERAILDRIGGADVTAYDESRFQANWDVTLDLNLEMAVAALHADVTRVATISVHDRPDGGGARISDFGYSDGHDFIHHVADPSDPLSSNPAAVAEHERQLEPHVQAFLRALDLLATRTESTGERLLDHTVVVWCSEIAYGDHAFDDPAWLTAGSAGGALVTGKNFDLGRRPTHDLFATVATAVGVPTDRFGDSLATGPITQALR